ncbi:MAG: hypothetical protein IRY91_11880 [Gemmatimonadaceae bacterium]|nr:hypothetical protein [Gemmatimonadaceae bacterium]
MRTDEGGRVALAAALALAFGAPSVSAQTSFAWPDTVVQVASYTRVDQCLAGVDRVRAGLARREALTVWRDTLPRDPREALEPEPLLVQETAQRCAARFAAASVDVHDFAPLLELYLAAGRDSDAAILLRRRLAAVPAKATHERAAVGDTAIRIYLAAQPARVAAAEEILLARARESEGRVRRIAIYSELMAAAKRAGDTTRARRAAQRLVAIADSLTTAERQSEEYERLAHGAGGDRIIYAALDLLIGDRVRLDSLRHSTASLVALERSLWAHATGERPEALQIPTGERAPTITADYWFPREAGSAPRPTPGRVALIIFLDHTDCAILDPSGEARSGPLCAAWLAKTRRLEERFPTLEITIVSRTHGTFLYEPPPAPPEEAELARQMLESYRVPNAAIAVTTTPFWRLPEPDRRRIDNDLPNRTAYSFDKSWRVGNGSAFLVDQNGLIVTAWRFDESDLVQLIDVLMQRARGKA